MQRRLFGVVNNCLPCAGLGEQVGAGVGAKRLEGTSVKRSKTTLAMGLMWAFSWPPYDVHGALRVTDHEVYRDLWGWLHRSRRPF
jgi:hypothetical protein